MIHIHCLHVAHIHTNPIFGEDSIKIFRYDKFTTAFYVTKLDNGLNNHPKDSYHEIIIKYHQLQYGFVNKFDF